MQFSRIDFKGENTLIVPKTLILVLAVAAPPVSETASVVAFVLGVGALADIWSRSMHAACRGGVVVIEFITSLVPFVPRAVTTVGGVFYWG
jgi:hypothetical protein